MLLRPVDQAGQRSGEPIRSPKCVGDSPNGTTQEHQSADLSGPPPIRLQRNLGAKRVTENDEWWIPQMIPNRIQVEGKVLDPNPVWISRGSASPMSAVVPVGHGELLCEVIPQVFEDIPVTR